MTTDGIDLQDPAALPAAAAAVARHVDALRQAAATAARRSSEVTRQVQGDVLALRGRLQNAQAALAAVPPDDVQALAAARARVTAAEHTVDRAVTVQRNLDRLLVDLDRAVRSHVATAEGQADAGMAALSRLWEQLGRSLAAFAAAARADVAPSVVSTDVPSSITPSPLGAKPVVGALIGTAGHVLVDLGKIDIDIPLTSSERAQLPGLLSGLERLEAVVLPVLASGGGPAEVQARDDARGAGGEYVEAYRLYFGVEPVKLNRTPDGRYEVKGGRHRIEAARLAGLDAIPAWIGSRL